MRDILRFLSPRFLKLAACSLSFQSLKNCITSRNYHARIIRFARNLRVQSVMYGNTYNEKNNLACARYVTQIANSGSNGTFCYLVDWSNVFKRSNKRNQSPYSLHLSTRKRNNGMCNDLWYQRHYYIER